MTCDNSTANGSLPFSTIEMLKNEKLQTVLPIFYIFIFIISIIINSLSMWILCCHAHPKSPTIIFAINLVLNDLLYTVTLPFQVTYHLKGNNWPFGVAMCSIVTLLFYGNMHCSIWTMMSISIERYLKIVHPLRFKTLTTNKTALVTCGCIWTLSLLLYSPYMYTNITCHVKQLQIRTCFDVLPRTMFPSRSYFYVYYACSAALTFYLPVLVMLACYSAIISTLMRSPPTQLKETKKQIIYLILVLLTVFLVCFLPNNLLQVLHLIYSRKKQSLYVEYKLSLGFSSLNCCLDPLVYYFGSREFRTHMAKKVFCCSTGGFLDATSSNTSDHSMPLTRPLG